MQRAERTFGCFTSKRRFVPCSDLRGDRGYLAAMREGMLNRRGGKGVRGLAWLAGNGDSLGTLVETVETF